MATIRESDTFATGGRGSPNAISPASNGHNWQQATGTSTLGFTGSAGTLNGTTSSNVLLLGSTTLPCFDVVCFFQPGVTQDLMGVVARYNSNGGTNYYRATCQVSGGIATFKITKVVLGGPTDIVTMTVTTETAGFWIHLSVSDLSQNNLNANYWLAGNTEPAGWMLTGTDQTAQLLVPGQVGIVSKANGTGSTQSFSSFTAQDVFSYAPPPAQPGDSPYGITLNVANGLPATIPLLTQQTIVDLLAQYGPGAWLRYQYQWASTEPNADHTYNWAVMDYAVSLCNSAGIRMLWPVQAPPAGYKTISAADGVDHAPTSGFAYANASTWQTFVTAVANRYNGTVTSPYTGYPMRLDALQLENEDYDSNSHTPRDIQSQWLVAVANACYPAIKAAAPSIRVGLCAVRKTATLALSHITNWVTNLYTYTGGIGGNADWLDFHYYRDSSTAGLDPTVSDANTPDIATELKTIRGIIAAHGQVQQVWCCEFGWNWYNANTDVNLTDSQVSSASQITQYTLAVYDALRTGGAAKGMLYTENPGAMVTVKGLLPGPVNTNVSSVQKSLTQTIAGVYTYLATWAALQSYGAQYPSFPQASALSVTTQRRDNAVAATTRDNVLTLHRRDNVASAATRSNQIVATTRDNRVATKVRA